MDNVAFLCWIQKVDYSLEERELSSLEEILSFYRALDWEALSEGYVESDENRNCPPGVGFDNGSKKGNLEGGLLHISLEDGGTFYFNLQYPVGVKRHFFFFKRSELEFFEKEGFPAERVEELIKLFFAGDYKEIMKL